MKNTIIFLVFFSLICHRIPAKNIAYIGLRSVDPYERLIAEKVGVHLYGMRVSVFHSFFPFAREL